MNENTLIKRDQYLYTEIQEGNSPTGLTPLQQWLSGHESRIEILLWILWFLVLAIAVRKLFLLSTNR